MLGYRIAFLFSFHLIILSDSSKYSDNLIQALRKRLESLIFKKLNSSRIVTTTEQFEETDHRINIPDPIFVRPYVFVTESAPRDKIEIKNICSHFKRGHSLNLENMSDVWEVVYYKIATDMACFKMYIRRNSDEEKQRLFELYGKLTNDLDWDTCNLEIKPYDDAGESTRKHLLVESLHYHGVMDNIIIEEEETFDGNSTFRLHKQSSDQWMVTNNLLLMRDCDTGDVVVFSRYPVKSSKIEVLNALKKFGENNPTGKMHCNNLT